jgi:hypothetical protein
MSATTDNPPARSVQRVVIVHGYEAAPDAHWLPWLQSALQAKGIGVTVVPLPDPDAPEPAAWENAVLPLECPMREQRLWHIPSGRSLHYECSRGFPSHGI